jgi:hypothetical protein
MASPPKTFKTTDGREITCREDLPNAARLLAPQRLLIRLYWVASLLTLLSYSGYFWAQSPWLIWPLSFFVLLGLLAPVLYPFLLLCFFRCPVCRNRFVMQRACPACGLPTHRDPAAKSLFAGFP